MTEAIPKTIKEHRYAGILGSIWRAVNIQNGMATIVFCGKRGKGKYQITAANFSCDK